MHVEVSRWIWGKSDHVLVLRHSDHGDNIPDSFTWAEARAMYDQLGPILQAYEDEQERLRLEYGQPLRKPD